MKLSADRIRLGFRPEVLEMPLRNESQRRWTVGPEGAETLPTPHHTGPTESLPHERAATSHPIRCAPRPIYCPAPGFFSLASPSGTSIMGSVPTNLFASHREHP